MLIAALALAITATATPTPDAVIEVGERLHRSGTTEIVVETGLKDGEYAAVVDTSDSYPDWATQAGHDRTQVVQTDERVSFNGGELVTDDLADQVETASTVTSGTVTVVDGRIVATWAGRDSEDSVILDRIRLTRIVAEPEPEPVLPVEDVTAPVVTAPEPAPAPPASAPEPPVTAPEPVVTVPGPVAPSTVPVPVVEAPEPVMSSKPVVTRPAPRSEPRVMTSRPVAKPDLSRVEPFYSDPGVDECARDCGCVYLLGSYGGQRVM